MCVLFPITGRSANVLFKVIKMQKNVLKYFLERFENYFLRGVQKGIHPTWGLVGDVGFGLIGVFVEGHGTIHVTEKGNNRIRLLVIHGTGPLACLSLFPVAELDKVS